VSGRVEDKKGGLYPGYPDRYKPHRIITGLENISSDCLVFHAGTEVDQAGSLVTTGGRVLNIVGRGKTLEEAREMAYQEIKKVHFEGMRYRTDIGLE
jgi:phosphoribosylamine--glycine ligase